MNTTIIQAIQKRCKIELRYHGFSRIVEPHAYGRNKDGEELLRCYQVSGGSESGERIGWKLLKVGEAFSILPNGEIFQPRPDYKQNDKALEFVFCQL